MKTAGEMTLQEMTFKEWMEMEGRNTPPPSNADHYPTKKAARDAIDRSVEKLERFYSDVAQTLVYAESRGLKLEPVIEWEGDTVTARFKLKGKDNETHNH